jgi:hypothetical protein
MFPEPRTGELTASGVLSLVPTSMAPCHRMAHRRVQSTHDYLTSPLCLLFLAGKVPASGADMTTQTATDLDSARVK